MNEALYFAAPGLELHSAQGTLFLNNLKLDTSFLRLLAQFSAGWSLRPELPALGSGVIT